MGHQLINYYPFSGGHNPPLYEPVGDGNDRVAFTNERHGFAATVDPEGLLNPTHTATTSAVRAVRTAEHLLADIDDEHDDVVLGYVPDHYPTENFHPSSIRRQRMVPDIERFRGMGSRDILARALLLGGHSFGAIDLSGGRPCHPARPRARNPGAARRVRSGRRSAGAPRSAAGAGRRRHILRGSCRHARAHRRPGAPAVRAGAERLPVRLT